MRENYTKPVSEVEEFNTVDVLTSSTGGIQQGQGGFDGGTQQGGGGWGP